MTRAFVLVAALFATACSQRAPPDREQLAALRSRSLASLLWLAARIVVPTNPPIPSGWPIVVPGLLMAYAGPLLYVRWSEGHSSEAERVHLTELRRALDARTDAVRVGVVYEFRNTDGIPALGRSDLARLFNERREILQKTTAAFALVTESLLTRASLKAVFWIAPPPYPHVTVGDLDAGLQFVARHLPDLDPARARAECDALCQVHQEKLRAKSAS